MPKSIEEKVIELLEESLEEGTSLEGINADDDLRSYGINSVNFIKFVVAAEIEFDLEFDEDDMEFENFMTIGNIVEYIEKFQDSDDD